MTDVIYDICIEVTFRCCGGLGHRLGCVPWHLACMAWGKIRKPESVRKEVRRSMDEDLQHDIYTYSHAGRFNMVPATFESSSLIYYIM